MKKPLISLAFATLSIVIAAPMTASLAFAREPSDASVEALLVLLGIDKTPALILTQMDQMTANTVRDATMGREPNADEQKVIHAFEQKSQAVRAELAERSRYDLLKPDFVAAYKEIFSQDDIDQLAAFYQTPTGKMLVAKMPLATQRSTSLLQQRVTPVFYRMQQAATEMKQQLDALHAPKPAAAQ